MYAAIVFLPLLTSVIAGLGGRLLGARLSGLVTTVGLFASAALSVVAFINVALLGGGGVQTIATWISSGGLSIDWAVRVDTMTAVMLVVVTFVSSLVHLYSIGYMKEEEGQPRFFAYLSFFTFSMLMLVTANNFLQLFFGWEGVGLASYLLIGFWYTKPSANAAALKAFVVNRVGDFGFTLGVLAIYLVFGTLDFDAVFAAAPAIAGKSFVFAGMHVDILTTICLLLFVGAMGKSAQLGLHTWLPDAMEGPTPVSALIHAATMVTAGVFLVCRASPLFAHAPFALEVVTVVGATTAFFAATVGLFQNDIKRVIAYSTCSQLGYMFAAAGLSAYNVAMFHLFTHAFFKALLFLSAGAVIVAMHHEQDMRKMGGLRKALPFSWAMMLIGNLALTGFGIPFTMIGTAGFFSKDAIISTAYLSHSPVAHYAFVLLVIAAAMTAFYSWRQFFMVFYGKYNGGHGAHGMPLEKVHEAPLTMLIPLGVLAFGALFAGLAFDSHFIGATVQSFWHGTLVLAAAAAHEVPVWVELAPFTMMLIGFAIAYYFYIAKPALTAKLQAQNFFVYRFLYNKWYIDELYGFLFVRPSLALGRLLWKLGDGKIIDGLGPDGIAARVLDGAKGAGRLQSGYIYQYAFAMLAGIVILTGWFV
ncbi:MAG: NADH-quinone oxidoreductase subunit L, partial [Rhizomicrobium sp.]